MATLYRRIITPSPAPGTKAELIEIKTSESGLGIFYSSDTEPEIMVAYHVDDGADGKYKALENFFRFALANPGTFVTRLRARVATIKAAIEMPTS